MLFLIKVIIKAYHVLGLCHFVAKNTKEEEEEEEDTKWQSCP